MKNATPRGHDRKWWFREIRSVLLIAIVVFSIRSSFADWNDVPTGSMKPTILEGDRVFVNKLAYDLKVPFTTWHLAEWSNPQRGDVVVFYSPYDGTRLVKRVVGLPGDRIQLRNEQLFVQGKPARYAPLGPEISQQLNVSEQRSGLFAKEILDDHAHAVMAIPSVGAKRSFGPMQVPEGCYFMLGDNRDNSFDSRYFGSVPREKILGKAVGIAMSLDKQNYYLPRAQRFLRALD